MRYVNFFTIIAMLITITSVVFSAKKIYDTGNLTSQSPYSLHYDSMANIYRNWVQSLDHTMPEKEYSFNSIKSQDFAIQTFWIKVIFSSIFCIAALFVILSKKYDEETKKWAFSVLTLIAGVWIGTIS